MEIFRVRYFLFLARNPWERDRDPDLKTSEILRKNSERKIPKIPTSRRSRSEFENPKKTLSGKSRKSRNPGDEDQDQDIPTKSHPFAPILLTLGTNNEKVKEFLTRFAGFSYFIKSQEIKTQVSVNYI